MNILLIVSLTIASITSIIVSRKYTQTLPASLDNITIRQFITYVLLVVITSAVCLATVIEYLKLFGLIGVSWTS